MRPYPREYFQRYDESDDSLFYQTPRKVVHIDDRAILLLKAYYATVLPRGAVLLDLMSSWRSHYPDDLQPQRVYAHGMNAEEMADNPQIDEYIVQNLNRNQSLPYASDFFDGVTCAVSVQYLIKPVEVFREVNRVLKPGGRFIVSFSNRCFPTKAIAAWLSMTDMQHVALVVDYFQRAGGYTDITTDLHTTGGHDPLFIVTGRKA
ncbi:class I SAM-dependent methyltransferase [Aggregatilineales bacterium SYSU G02658]